MRKPQFLTTELKFESGELAVEIHSTQTTSEFTVWESHRPPDVGHIALHLSDDDLTELAAGFKQHADFRRREAILRERGSLS